ncbi:hypothetical protein [Fodinicola feengrottensis]|uniref:hypothetical protein n=1 Tax=Fodinicola feengrottensis TaxID=435914 RepID=UPI0024436513|nr:hypothetical protein [Fodinicola feengrottensis]
MTTQDHSTAHEPATANGVTPAYPMPGKDPYVDANDPEADQFDLVREGARRDGVELVHYAPRFPVPGTKREKRVERTIAFMFGLSGLFGLAFLVVYIWWPYDYQLGVNIAKLYTPMLGITLGFARCSSSAPRSSPSRRSCCPKRSRSRIGTTVRLRTTSAG